MVSILIIKVLILLNLVSPNHSSSTFLPKDTVKIKRETNMLDFRLSLPLQSKLYVTSSYGWRYHPVLGKRLKHNGVDLRARFQPVYSISIGTIEKIGKDARSGNYVIIDNFNNIETIFCHLSKVVVHIGDTVRAGQPFAISGATGKVTGPHLHFGIKVRGKYINPFPILKAIIRRNYK